MYAQSLGCVQLCNPMKCSPPGVRFPRQEYGSGLPFPTPRDLPNPGIEKLCLLSPLHWKANFFLFFYNCDTWEAQLIHGKKINNPTKKWAKDLTRHFIKEHNTNGQQAHTKMLDIISHQGSASQNHSVVSSHIH